MADEYINKTELLFEMVTSLIPQSMDITMGYAIAKDLIRKAPTVDVAPVIHGEWLEHDYEHYIKPDNTADIRPILYRCSLCGRVENQKEPYCHCGARMDGGNE